jgi:hypothetical protein
LSVESGYTKSGDTESWSGCAKIIKDACDKMKKDGEDGKTVSNDFFADELGKAIKQMADDGEVNTTVLGEVKTPSGAVSSLGGTAKGTISVVDTSLISTLKTLFSSSSFTDNLFASTMATAIDTMYKAGQISTDGQGAIEGSSGSGAIA